MKKYTLFLVVLVFTFLSKEVSSQTLISSQYLGQLSKIEMQAFYGAIMQNGIKRYKITYLTNDIHGVPDTASGLVVIPIRDEPKNYPLLCYQHGTVSGPNDVPSNLNGGTTLATIWAGLGYITSAADYLGLGEARGFHPYVHADTEASAAVDMLFATRQFVAENNYHLNDQLFITGYSQGGHAAMAVQRSIQENYQDDFTITAAAPMSGPYSISTAMLGLSQNESPYYYIGYIPYTILSMRLAYDLDYELEEIFKQSYIAAIDQFYHNEIDLNELHNSLINTIQSEESDAPIPKYIFQDSFLVNISTNYNHPFNVALRDNDVYDWAPTSPTRLYYCMADDQVPFTNSIIADSVMNMNGAVDLQAIDVNSNFDHGQCVRPAITQAALFFLPLQSITTDLKTIKTKSSPIFYPNPNKGLLSYQSMDEPMNITIYDLEGKIKYEAFPVIGKNTLDLTQLPKGFYFLQWETAHKSQVERIIID